MEVAAIKDGASVRPIPTAWRAALCRIVDAFVDGDYGLVNGLSEIEAVLRRYGQPCSILRAGLNQRNGQDTTHSSSP